MEDPIPHPNGSSSPLSVEEWGNVLTPTTPVPGAVFAGYGAHRLPLRAIASAQVRVMAAIAPPALFLSGAAKVCEFLHRQQAARKLINP
jgi:hypothetical protein